MNGVELTLPYAKGLYAMLMDTPDKVVRYCDDHSVPFSKIFLTDLYVSLLRFESHMGSGLFRGC
jgi:hypothetical protein